MARASMARRPGNWRPDDRADVKRDQPDENRQPDDQDRDGGPGRGVVQGQQVVQGHQRGGGSGDPQHGPHDHAGRGPGRPPGGWPGPALSVTGRAAICRTRAGTTGLVRAARCPRPSRPRTSYRHPSRPGNRNQDPRRPAGHGHARARHEPGRVDGRGVQGSLADTFRQAWPGRPAQAYRRESLFRMSHRGQRGSTWGTSRRPSPASR